MSEEEVIADGDLNGYSEDVENDVLLEDDDAMDDGTEDLFEDLGDEGEDMLFDNDLAEDNLNDEDDIM